MTNKKRQKTSKESKNQTLQEHKPGGHDDSSGAIIHQDTGMPDAKTNSSGKMIMGAIALIAVIVLGYGLMAQGIPLPAASAASASKGPSDDTAKVEGGYQVIHMNVTAYGWQPDRFVLKAGMPVKWVIDGQTITGCNRAIKVPSIGLSFDIKKGEQTIEFTPKSAGTIPWSCWMGMIHGTFIVKDNIDATSPEQVKAALDESPKTPAGGSCGMGGGGGCGCGMM